MRRIAYLQSQYPALSMIWVIREVVQLRGLGFTIDVASINDPDRAPRHLTAEELVESEHAYYVKSHGVVGASRAHLHALLRRPKGWLSGVRLVFRLGGADILRVIKHFLYLSEALMVGAWMHSKGHSHLHVHLGSQSATVGLYVKKVFDVGFSITVHGPDEFYDADRQSLGDKVAAADFICCISDFARSQLMKLSPYEHWHKLIVSRLGIDPSVFAPRSSPREEARFEILCVGRLTPAKGQHILLDAVAALSLQGRSLCLRIVGAGTDLKSLRRHADAATPRNSVVFEGAVNQDRIRDLYASADCFCLPSFAEGIPVVLMEAMAMEIACVTTHITGIPELIRNEVDGLLVPPSNVDELVKALARLMDDPELRHRLGKSARDRVKSEYDLSKNVSTLAGIFEKRIRSS